MKPDDYPASVIRMNEDKAPEGLLGDYLDEKQCAEELGIKVSTLQTWRGCNKGPASTKVGRKVIYRRSAVRDWLKDQERGR